MTLRRLVLLFSLFTLTLGVLFGISVPRGKVAKENQLDIPSIPNTTVDAVEEKQEVVEKAENLPHLEVIPNSAPTQKEDPIISHPEKVLVPHVATTSTQDLVVNSMSTSSPQDVSVPSSLGALNQYDILLFTNNERVKNGLAPLRFSQRLTAIAEAKNLDMIAKQYFEHVSPSGVGIKQLSEIYGYQYITIGENLALGYFTDSADVVDGWMNSPGHRANILKSDYTEIGISTMRGVYEGEEVWFAVQEFGRPLADCPPPDTFLEKKIIIYNSQLKSLQQTLDNLKAEMETESIVEKNKKIEDYNTIVALFNNILETTQKDIETFNRGVREYNFCIDKAV